MMILLLGLLSCSSLAHAQPVRASEDEQRQIMEQVETVNKTYGKYATAFVMESRLRERYQREKGLPPAEMKTWYAMLRQMDEAEGTMRAAAAEAIRLTRLYYQVGPVYEGMPIANGPFKEKNPVWNPQFYLDPREKPERYRQVQDAQGKDRYIGGPIRPRDGGYTEAAGDTIILIAPFWQAIQDKNPTRIALVLNHETFHYDELVTKGWDSYNGGETRAYGHDLSRIYEVDGKAVSAVDILVDEKKYPAQYRKVVKHIRGQRDDASAALRKNPKPRSIFPTPEEEKEMRKKWVDLETEKTLVGGVRGEMRELVVGHHWQGLNWMVADLCAGVSQVSQAELNGLDYLEAFDYRSISVPVVAPGSANCHDALAGQVLYKLGQGERLDATWLSGQAAMLRRRSVDDALESIRRTERYRAELKTLFEASVGQYRRIATRECSDPGKVSDVDVRDLIVSYRWLVEYEKVVDAGVVLAHVVPEGLSDCARDLTRRWLVRQMQDSPMTTQSCNEASLEAARTYPPPPEPGGRPPLNPGGSTDDADHDRIRVPTLDEVLDRLNRGH